MVRTLLAIAYSQPIFFTLKFIAITSKGRRSVQRTVDLDRSIDPGGGGGGGGYSGIKRIGMTIGNPRKLPLKILSTKICTP